MTKVGSSELLLVGGVFGWEWGLSSRQLSKTIKPQPYHMNYHTDLPELPDPTKGFPLSRVSHHRHTMCHTCTIQAWMIMPTMPLKTPYLVLLSHHAMEAMDALRSRCGLYEHFCLCMQLHLESPCHIVPTLPRLLWQLKKVSNFITQCGKVGSKQSHTCTHVP